MKAYRCVGVCLSLVLGLSPARADVISTFDVDADGWTLFQNTGAPFGWVSSGGNPGGHLTATDKTNDWAYVQAPAKFLVPAPYGGVFAFDLRVDNLDQPPGFPGVFNVRAGLQGAGLTLINEGLLPTTSWNSFSFALDEAAASGWRKFTNLSQNYSNGAPLATQAEMQAVLAGLTRVVIATDYTNATLDNVSQPIDQAFIDNVRLSEVPEPSTAAILAVVYAAGFRSRKH